MRKSILFLVLAFFLFLLGMKIYNVLDNKSRDIEFDYSWNLMRKQIDASRPEFNISAQINAPIIDQDEDSVLAGFNLEVQKYIEEVIRTTYDGLNTPLENPGGFMNVDYAITTSPAWSLTEYSARDNETLSAVDAVLISGHPILSIVFNGSGYFGGAHPYSWHHTINYDLSSGQLMALADLFHASSPYLQTISEYCIRDLSTGEHYVFDDFAEDGAAAKEENYADWAITPRGLLIIFEEYQVAPYAAGPQYVLIPYDILSEMIDPIGPIGELATGNN
jgi:hypothetical protein